MEGMNLTMVSLVMAGVIAMFAALLASVCNTVVLRQFMIGLSRQPEAKDALLTSAMISVGLIEALPIIATVIALILLFANPLLK